MVMHQAWDGKCIVMRCMKLELGLARPVIPGFSSPIQRIKAKGSQHMIIIYEYHLAQLSQHPGLPPAARVC